MQAEFIEPRSISRSRIAVKFFLGDGLVLAEIVRIVVELLGERARSRIISLAMTFKALVRWRISVANGRRISSVLGIYISQYR